MRSAGGLLLRGPTGWHGANLPDDLTAISERTGLKDRGRPFNHLPRGGEEGGI